MQFMILIWSAGEPSIQPGEQRCLDRSDAQLTKPPAMPHRQPTKAAYDIVASIEWRFLVPSLLINDAIFHHKHDLLHRLNVLERIARDGNDVGPFSGGQ